MSSSSLRRAIKEQGTISVAEIARAQLEKFNAERISMIRAAKEVLKQDRYSESSQNVEVVVNGEGLLTTLKVRPNQPVTEDLVIDIFNTIRAAQTAADAQAEQGLIDRVLTENAQIVGAINGD